MAETFLHELFQPSNLVQSDTQEQKCDICLQETGSMSRETGLIELQVRLPCSHVVGSGCIAVWLKNNNSCPICRREFFPRPSLEDGMVLDQDEDDEEEEEQEEYRERLQLLETICQNYCLQLDLDRRTISIAQMIMPKLVRLYPFYNVVTDIYDDNAVGLVALGIYIASCLTDHPRSPREICRVEDANGHRIQESCAISSDHIRSFYGIIYEQKEELIDDRILESLEGHDVFWPSYDLYSGSDDLLECRRDLLTISVRCANECANLQVPSPMDDLAQHIAANLIQTGFHAYSHPENSQYVSESEITAVSIYIASHLVGRPISPKAIQGLIGDLYPDIRFTYRVVRRACNELVKKDYGEKLGVQLSWETLEAEVGEQGDGSRHEDPDEAEATRGGATPNVFATATRTQRLFDLCDAYVLRLEPPNDHRTFDLARALSERFDSLPIFAGRCPESIAAACVYISCMVTDRQISYAFLVAKTAVSITSIHTTHMMMVREINLGRVNIEDIIEPLQVHPHDISSSLPAIGY